jgi:hypothetical protein
VPANVVADAVCHQLQLVLVFTQGRQHLAIILCLLDSWLDKALTNDSLCRCCVADEAVRNARAALAALAPSSDTTAFDGGKEVRGLGGSCATNTWAANHVIGGCTH